MTLAVVLAGGLGRRLRHLHPDVPKPLIEVAGRPFLAWVLDHLAREGVSRTVISAGHLGEAIERWLSSRPSFDLAVSCAREPEPLGTAGGFAYALRSGDAAQEEPVVVVNGDSLVLGGLREALARCREPGTAAAIVGLEVDDAARFGSLEVDEDERLVAFRERRPGRGLVNAGVYVLAPATAAAISDREPGSFERDVFPGLLAAGETIRVVRTTAPFIDIGVPESLARAEAFLTRYVLEDEGP